MPFINTITNVIPSAKIAGGLSPELLSKFMCFWQQKYDGDDLLLTNGDVITVTDKDWTSRYIPYESAATFALPDEEAYQLADAEDLFWFDDEGNRLQKTQEDLISSTTMRTFIKYADFDPFNIYEIGILNPDAVLTEDEIDRLHRYFKLSAQYWGVDFNFNGYFKDNRDWIFPEWYLETYDDWYLPSRDEFNAINTNLRLHGVGNIYTSGTKVYCSSTELAAGTAVFPLFFNGTFIHNNSGMKYESGVVRPIRHFTAPAGTFNLRDKGPAGGWIFYINGTTYYEAAPADIGSFMWTNNAVHSTASGATGTAIGTGKNNSDLIVAQVGHTTSAAKQALDYSISG